MKTRHGLFRLAHMDDGHENGQASVLFLFSPPHRKAFHVSINRSGGSPLSSHHLQRQRDLLRVDVRPRFVCPGIGRAEAGPCELSHRRLHHEDGASLAPGGLLGLRIHRNLCGAGSGAGSARPHRLRLPPAMGEKKLARASVSQRAVPLTHAKQRSFALETISASKKRTTPPEGGVGKFMERATGLEPANTSLGSYFHPELHFRENRSSPAKSLLEFSAWREVRQKVRQISTVFKTGHLQEKNRRAPTNADALR